MKIMDINLKLRIDLFAKDEPTLILFHLVEMFKSYAKENNFKPVLLIIPQKDDIDFINNNYHYYSNFLNRLKDIVVIDMYDIFPRFEDYPIYSDDDKYGGHPNDFANQIIAAVIKKKVLV